MTCKPLYGKLHKIKLHQVLMIVSLICGLCGAVVSVDSFKAKDHGFKSTHGCSHTVQKPSINPRLTIYYYLTDCIG